MKIVPHIIYILSQYPHMHVLVIIVMCLLFYMGVAFMMSSFSLIFYHDPSLTAILNLSQLIPEQWISLGLASMLLQDFVFLGLHPVILGLASMLFWDLLLWACSSIDWVWRSENQ